MKTFHLFLVLFVGFFTATPTAAAPLDNTNVVVSIKPLHSLVANISAGVFKPVLILSGPSSPHTYQLKPSNASAIAHAKVIFWIGPQFEVFLKKPIATLGHNSKDVSFSQISQGNDPHMWLDPANFKIAARTIAATLSQLDPSNSNAYQRNLQTTIKRLDDLDKTLSTRLATTKSFVVFHNAYSHLAKRYNLKIIAALVDNPELRPGAKRLRQIRRLLQSANVTCIFAEPHFDQKIITTLTGGTSIKTGTLDPLGSDIPPGPDQYFRMMNRLALNLAQCY